MVAAFFAPGLMEGRVRHLGPALPAHFPQPFPRPGVCQGLRTEHPGRRPSPHSPRTGGLLPGGGCPFPRPSPRAAPIPFQEAGPALNPMTEIAQKRPGQPEFKNRQEVQERKTVALLTRTPATGRGGPQKADELSPWPAGAKQLAPDYMTPHQNALYSLP